MAKKFHLSIVLTNKCNLNCIYCYESGKSNHSISVNRIKEIVSEYLNSPNYDEVEIDFFGGEPFLEFEKIKEVCEWAWANKWRNKYLFFATTNGVLVHGGDSGMATEKQEIFLGMSQFRWYACKPQ